MKLLAFPASNSRDSINKKLVTYAVNYVKNNLLDSAKVEVLDLNEYEMPLYSIDKEVDLGIPKLANDFYKKISDSDALVISFAEHNGNYTVAYKNILDWGTRINKKIFQNKPMILLSTSPGERGAATVLEMAVNSTPFLGGQVLGYLSIPNFDKNYDKETKSLKNIDLENKFKVLIKKLVN